MSFILAFRKPAELIDGYVVENAGLALANGTYTLVENETSFGNRKVYSNGKFKLGFLDEDMNWYGWSIIELDRTFEGVGGDPGYSTFYYGPELDKNSSIGPESTNGNWSVGKSPATSPVPTIRQATTDDLNNKPEEDRGTILIVSGCIDGLNGYYVDQSKQMNGNYYLIDKNATGSVRIWKHELYEYYIVCYEVMSWWVITDSPDNTKFSIKTESSANPYNSDGSSCTWYYGPNIASNIKITATNF